VLSMEKSLIRYFIITLSTFLLGVGCIGSTDENNFEPKPSSTKESKRATPKTYDSPPEMAIDTSKTYTATFKLAGGKGFVVELFPEIAPITVNSFVFLCREGYFDNTTFHRVITGFMSQGGDPTGTGRGGPGYTFENEFHPDAKHDAAGILSMANAGIQNGQATNGSQFFIIHAPTPHLDGMHTVFGKVIKGLEVAVNLRERDPQFATYDGERIETIEITEK